VRHHRLVERYSLAGRSGRIAVPALILSGDRDLLVSERSLADLVEGIPQSESVRLPGCGHLAFVTQPEKVAEEVRRFLSGAETHCEVV
jgi:pimeloyl-ACP methyl ester carboxylesterase